MSTIIEVETNVERGLGRGAATVWHSRMGIDLRWVAAARTYAGEAPGDATTICMAGSGVFDVINVPYAKFMELWMKAKGLSGESRGSA